MQDEGDDPTVPTGRAGVDPLLAYPRESTGYTGEIERPGDQTPWWFIPGLFAVAVFFIGLLSLISQDRATDRLNAQQAADAQAAASQAEAAQQAAGGVASIEPAVTEPAITEPEAAEPETTEQEATEQEATEQEGGLPPAGTVRIGDQQYEISARCEVQLPFDPSNVTVQVSSYVYFDDDGLPGLIDRVVDGDSDSASLFASEALFVGLEVIGDDGAFTASFDGAPDVTVNPSSGPSQCNDRLVTNAPGQFTEPFTRTVLDVCIDGDTTVGLASLGGRFEVTENEAGATIVLQDPGGGLRRVSSQATVLRAEETLSASGIVAEGDEALDISIDVGFSLNLDAARECQPSDRL